MTMPARIWAVRPFRRMPALRLHFGQAPNISRHLYRWEIDLSTAAGLYRARLQFGRVSRLHGGVDGQRHSSALPVTAPVLARRRRRCGRRAPLDDAAGQLRSVGRRLRGGAVVAADAAAGGVAERAEAAEAVDDGVSKAAVHRAVDDEVDGAVDEHEDVPDVAERRVNGVEQVLVEAAQQRQHALRQLRHDEAQHDGDEHRRGPVALAGAVRLAASTLREKAATAEVGDAHGAHEQRAERDQHDARHHLHRHAEHPEVDRSRRVRHELVRIEPVPADDDDDALLATR